MENLLRRKCFLKDTQDMSDSWVLYSLLVVVPAILACLLVLWLVRKAIPAEKLRKHHDVAGFTFSIVGVLYSVILGFTVINVQERFNAAEETIHTEAAMLADLYRDAGFFPETSRDTIRAHLRTYVHYVLKEEWGSSNIHLQAQSILKEIWESYYSVELENDKVKLWYQQSISKLDKLMNARLAREFSSWQQLSSMMWTLLILGALITVCFMFFFGLDSMRFQMLMTSLLAGYLSFMLFLVFTLDHVFTGPERVRPTAFEQVLPLFNPDTTIQ